MKRKNWIEDGEFISYLGFVLILGVLIGLMLNFTTLENNYQTEIQRCIKNNEALYEEYKTVYIQYYNLPSEVRFINEKLLDFDNTYIKNERTCTTLTKEYQSLICDIPNTIYCINNSIENNHVLLKLELIVDPTSKEIYILNNKEAENKYVPCPDLYFEPYQFLFKYYMENEGLWDNYIIMREPPIEVEFTKELMYTSINQYLDTLDN